MMASHHEREVGFVLLLDKRKICMLSGLLFHWNAMEFYRNIYPFIWIMPWDCVVGYMYSYWIRMMPWDYVSGFVLSLDDDAMGLRKWVCSFIG
jgi:hypothetical protein